MKPHFYFNMQNIVFIEKNTKNSNQFSLLFSSSKSLIVNAISLLFLNEGIDYK